jgi:nitrogen fixation NifU-like protein
MSDDQKDNVQNANGTRELLLASGYAERAIDYFLRKPNMGSIPDANHVTELTGPCGDTMRCYLKLDDQGRIQDAKYQVLGCPGAISAAMALVDLVRGKTLDEALIVKDRDVFRELVDIPDQKQHCIRLAVKTLEKAIKEYTGENPNPMEGTKPCPCSTSSACNVVK